MKSTPKQSMTAAQRSAQCALVRLDPAHPAFTASPEVAAALRSIAPYLHTWVYPHLAYAAGHEEGYFGERRDLQRDAVRQANAGTLARLKSEGEARESFEALRENDRIERTMGRHTP